MPATNAAMKPDPSSARRDPVGERGAGRRDHLPPRGRDQVAPAGLGDDHGDQQPGDHAAQDAVADLLQQQRAGAAAAGDLRFDVGDRDGREQQRHADPVVEPALDVEPWRMRCGTRGSVTTACPSAASVGASTTAEDHGLLDGQLAEDREPRPRRPARSSAAGRSRAAGRARRPCDAAHRGRCATRRRTTPARAWSPPRRARLRSSSRVDPVEHLGADQQPEGDEQDRRRDRRPRQPPRDRGDAEQRERHESERPLHLSASCGVRRLVFSARWSRGRSGVYRKIPGPRSSRRSSRRSPRRSSRRS